MTLEKANKFKELFLAYDEDYAADYKVDVFDSIYSTDTYYVEIRPVYGCVSSYILELINAICKVCHLGSYFIASERVGEDASIYIHIG